MDMIPDHAPRRPISPERAIRGDRGRKIGGPGAYAQGPEWRRLNLSHLPQDQRHDAFQAAYNGPFEFTNLSVAKYDISYKVREVGSIAISDVRFPPLQARLKPANRQPTDPDVLYLAMFKRGIMTGISGDRSISGNVGEIHVADLSRDLTVMLNGVHHYAAFIPHKLIGYDPGRHLTHGSLTMRSGAGRMLAAAFTALHEAPDSGMDDSEAADAFLALVRAVLLGRVEDERAARAIAQTRRSQFRGFIEANLTHPDLSVDKVCRAFGASRATVYRDFAEDGGIRHYIQTRRLEHARSALAVMAPDRGAVARVGDRFGFVSQAHFNRAFRAAYGTTPGAILGSELPSQSA